MEGEAANEGEDGEATSPGEDCEPLVEAVTETGEKDVEKAENEARAKEAEEKAARDAEMQDRVARHARELAARVRAPPLKAAPAVPGAVPKRKATQAEHTAAEKTEQAEAKRRRAATKGPG